MTPTNFPPSSVVADTIKKVVAVVLLVLLPCAAVADSARQGYTEVALAAATLERKAVIADRIELSEEEGREFWPIYNDYLTRHEQLSKRLVDLLQRLSLEFETLDDRTADQLLDDYHEFREDRLALRWKTAKKLRKKIGSKRVARFYQIENKLDTLMDMDLVKNVPLVKVRR